MNNFRDDADIQREIRGIYTCGNVIIKNFRSFCVDIKTLLFKTYCTGIYASQLWCNYNVATLKRIQVSYISVFRHFMFLEQRASVSSAMITESIPPSFTEILG